MENGTEGTNPTRNREGLKGEPAAGEYKSSVEVILASFGRLLQMLTRRKVPPTAWISALVIALLVALIAYLSALFTVGLGRHGYRTIALGAGLLFLNLILAKSTFDRAFATLQDRLLNGLESGAGLSGLHDWLSAAADIKRPVLIGLLVWVASVFLVVPDPVGTPVETIVMGVVMFFWTGFMFYYMYLFALLPLRLSRCQFKLHKEDPATTEVLGDWSDMMKFAAYVFAFMLATGTLFTVAIGTWQLGILVFIIPRWLPLITLFVVNQVAISKVIKSSKRKSLNEVESLMEALRPGEVPPEHETMETLLWLWDYRDRIQGTHDSMLDWGGILNLVNTLLIPLLAFLIANREAILELLGWSM